MSREIEIKITIPEHEYKQWHTYEHGIAEVKQELRTMIYNRLKQDYIRSFNIEINEQNT